MAFTLPTGRGTDLRTWQTEPKARAFFIARGMTNQPAPMLDGDAAEIESQPDLAFAFLALRKFLKERRRDFRRHAGAFVINGDQHLIVFALVTADGHGRFGRAVAQRIFGEI